MNQLVDVLERLADRGTPRGADDVYDGAVLATDRSTAESASPYAELDSLKPSLDFVELDEDSSGRTRRHRPWIAVALLASVAVLAVLVVVRPAGLVTPAPQEPVGANAGTSSTEPGSLVGVPAVSLLSDSQPTASAARFGSAVAALLAARNETSPDLRETATRTTDHGQVAQFAYFADNGGRLYVAAGGKALISAEPGLLDQLAAGPPTGADGVLVWPETTWKRTIALNTADSVVIVSSEAVDHSGSARSVGELVDIATKVSADAATATFDAFASLPLGGPACTPPSPIIGNEFRGTSETAQLSGLIFNTKSSMRAGDDVKLVIRMTGSGPLVVTEISPTGATTTPPTTPHSGSTFDRPGDEWDTEITYSQAGCWQVHLTRNGSVADVWFQIAP